MADRSYKVILEGTIREGADRGEVVRRLAAVFKKDVQVVERLLRSAPRPIRKGLNLAEARKYTQILERIGASVRVEPEQPARVEVVREAPRPRPVEKPAPSDTSRPEKPADAFEDAACPKCGYVPQSAEDVLLVRGDCPRCGLRVRKDVVIEDLELQPLGAVTHVRRGLGIYQDSTPAAWNRRAVASIHTLNLFLIVYTILVFLAAFMLVPLESIPEQLASHFVDMALDLFPMFLVSVAVLVVLFAFPIFNEGLSWGQGKAGIQVLYTDEAQIGGLYFTLGCRSTAALILTLVPGSVLVWIGSQFGWFESVRVWSVVMIGMAAVGWVASWITVMQRQDERGVLDLAAGTVQTEENPLRPNAMNQALLHILPVLGFWLLFGALIPLLMRFFFSSPPK